MNHPPKISIFVKLAYSLFVAVLVPYYWVTYSPWNFLYFCDLALLLTLAALWLEGPLLASMPAVGITLPQILWVADFLSGSHLIGMTAYMFDPRKPLFVRALSSFHGWLPFLLWWLVWRLGYDRRAFLLQTLLAWAVLLVCYGFGPRAAVLVGHPNFAVNINYVFGLHDDKPQTWMSPQLWLALQMVLHPVCLYLPVHLVLRKVFPQRERPALTGNNPEPQ